MSKNSNVILIDIDGVACEHAKAICEVVNKDYGTKANINDVTTWDHNFGPITFTQAVDKYYPNNDFILSMDVSYGFHAFLKEIGKILTIKFASNRKKYCHDATMQWVKKHFGDCFKISFIDKKINLVKFDYIIDDSLSEVLLSINAGKIGFLMKRPWNNNNDTIKCLSQLENAYFIDDFPQIIQIIKGR